MPVTDEESAIAAISTLHELSEQQTTAKTSVEAILNDVDNPHVDIFALFSHFNVLYFRGLLTPRVEVSWSSRLTLCAGICELCKDEHGKYRRIRLKLSEPLLKFRPKSDTVNTLLHESIHAYFFLTTSWRHSRGDDGTGHGGGFLVLADAINNHGGYEVTVYHTFHDEVASYRTHVWQCGGPCRTQPPYFGLVKRSMNRPPGKGDSWWKKHEEECGGSYVKIMQPAPTKKQIEGLSALERAGRQKNKIDAWAKSSDVRQEASQELSLLKASEHAEETCKPAREPGRKRRGSPLNGGNPKRAHVICPICEAQVEESAINDHLDRTHQT